jgi:hypothetical protein
MNRSENVPFRVHFDARLRRIVSLFNDKSAGLLICTAKGRPGWVRHTDVPHVIAQQNGPNKGHLQPSHLLPNSL